MPCRSQVGGERGSIEPVDPHGKVIHVAARAVFRLAGEADAGTRSIRRGAGPQLDQLGLLEPALDMTVEDGLVELDRAIEIADAKHDVVEPGNRDARCGVRSRSRLDTP